MAAYHAKLSAFGSSVPKKIVNNFDLEKIVDTSDEWIRTRTGIRQRHIASPGEFTSHIGLKAAQAAIQHAGIDAQSIDLIVLATSTPDNTFPASAVAIQAGLGIHHGAAFDVQAVCSGFIFALSTADSFLRTGAFKRALVIGAELFSRLLDWEDRTTAVLFGDGCAAVVLQATDRDEGIVADKLGCYADARGILRVRGYGTTYGNRGVSFGDTLWDFDGQEIFKRAVHGMSESSAHVLAKAGVTADAVDLVVPHQANLRIIEFVAKRAGIPMERVFVTVHKYGNMSAATVPVALVDAIEEGRVTPGALILTPAFGAGLTWCSHLIRFGERVTPLATTDVELPPCGKTALEMVNAFRAIKDSRGRSAAGLAGPVFPESGARASG